MARIRTIKPEFWTSESVVECSCSARLLLIGMLNFADDYGNLVDSPKRLKMQIFPADNIDTSPLLEELIKNGLVIPYVVDGEKYLNIKGFRKHQVINKPSKSKIPLPLFDENKASDSVAVDEECVTTTVVVDDECVTEGNGMEWNGLNTKEKNAGASFEDSEPAYLKTEPRKPHEARDIFGMTVHWQPSETINHLLGRAGLTPDFSKIDQDRLSDFVNHWIGKPDNKTQDGWHGALVGWLKRTRHDKPAPKQQSGYQQKQQPPQQEYHDPAHRVFEPEPPMVKTPKHIIDAMAAKFGVTA